MELYQRKLFLKKEVILGYFFFPGEGRIEALGERWSSQRDRAFYEETGLRSKTSRGERGSTDDWGGRGMEESLPCQGPACFL